MVLNNLKRIVILLIENQNFNKKTLNYQGFQGHNLMKKIFLLNVCLTIIYDDTAQYHCKNTKTLWYSGKPSEHTTGLKLKIPIRASPSCHLLRPLQLSIK